MEVREQIENDLRDSEERYRMLAEAAFEGIVFTEQGSFVDVNKQFADMLGYGIPELIGRTVTDFVVLADREFVRRNMESGFEQPYEARLLHRDGTVIAVEARARHFQYRGRNVRVCAVQNITERKRIEGALLKSEERYRTIYDRAPISLWEEDCSAVKSEMDLLRAQGVTDFRAYLDAHPEFLPHAAQLIRIVDVNDMTLAMYGADSKAELLGNLTHIFAPASLHTLKEFLIAIAEGKSSFEAEAVNRKLNGELFDIYIQIAIPTEDAQFGNLLVSKVDITERKRMREALLEGEKRFRDLAELLPQTVFEADQAGTVTFANRQALTFLGYTMEELQEGLHLLQMLVPEDRERAAQNISRILRGERETPTGNEYTILKKDGTTSPVLVYSAPLIRGGKTVGLRGVVVDTTPLKQAEDALRRSEQQLADMFDKHSAIMYTFDPETLRITSANQAASEFYGYSREELKSMRIPDLNTLPENKIRALVAQQLVENRDFLIFKHRLANGEIRDVEVRSTPIQTALSGKLFFSIIYDITDRKRIEEALRDREERYRTLFEGASDAIVTIRDGLFVNCNRKALELFGCSREEFYGRTTEEFSPPLQPDGSVSREKRLQKIAAARTGIPQRFEWRHRRRDGTIFDAEVSLSRVENQNGEFQAIVRDITERKRAEAELFIRDRAIASSINAIAIADLDGHLTFVNGSFLRMWGYASEQEVIGKPHSAFCQSHAEAEELITVLRQNGHWMGEIAVCKKDGAVFDVRLSASLVRDDAGAPLCLMATFVDITETKRAERALQESEHVLKRLIEYSPVAIAIRDRDKNIEYINSKFITTFGYTREDIPTVADWWPRAYPDPEYRRDMQERWNAEVTRAIEEGREIAPLETRVTCKDGSVRTIEWFGTPVGDKLLVVLNDITEHKRVEEALRKAMEAADAANRAKSEFLANMSHEIRTPLTAIIGFTDLIRLEEDAAVRNDYLEMIKTSGDTLLHVVNDILDLAKIEAGKLELESVDFNLLDVIDQSTESQSIIARQKGINFAVRIDPATPLSLRGDPEHLRQILTNLVSNAVKFTHKGEIVVTVAPQPIPPDTGEGAAAPPHRVPLHFTVRDTGIGIPADKQAQIFESFTQADGSTSREYGGSGLGTTIARKLVELMGGAIWFDSVPGVGSNFHVTVGFTTQGCDRREIPQPEAALSVFAVLQETLRRKGFLRILLAEDNTATQRLVSDTLQHYGHIVAIADNGHDAVRLWQSEPYNLVLMDMQMPGMNGLEATTEIRRLERSRGGHTPIIAITANALKEDRESCIAAGMDDYLAKPVNVSELLEQLREGWAAKESPAAGAGSPAHLDIQSYFQLETMPAALRNDQAWLAEYVRLLLKDVGKGIGRIEQAIRDGNSAELERGAHAIKGVAVHIRDGRLRQLAADLEKMGATGRIDGTAEKVAQLMTEFAALTETVASGLHVGRDSSGARP